MAIFVEVMLAEKVPATGKHKQLRVPIAQVATLPTTDVLFVIISFETTALRSRRVIGGKHYERGKQMYGEDFVGLILRSNGKESTLVSWDTGFHWLDHADPRKESPLSGVPPVFPGNMIRFAGKQLLDPDWEVALAQFSDEMH